MQEANKERPEIFIREADDRVNVGALDTVWVSVDESSAVILDEWIKRS